MSEHAESLHFKDIAAPAPTREGLASRHAALHARLDEDAGPEALGLVIAEWDAVRRQIDSWSALVHLRFAQNTADPDAKAAREYADALAPLVTEYDVAMKRRLLATPEAAEVTGAHAIRLWHTDVTAFDPAIKSALEEESRVGARYTELLASAAIQIDGQTVNLAGLGPYAEHPDRRIRHDAERARWGFFAAHGEELDSLFDQLVQLRHGMARDLGFGSYTPLAYRNMRRVDYDAGDVARYRDQVAEHVVPLVARLLEARRLILASKSNV